MQIDVSLPYAASVNKPADWLWAEQEGPFVSTQTGFLKISVGENHGARGVCGVGENWWGDMKEITTWRTIL